MILKKIEKIAKAQWKSNVLLVENTIRIFNTNVRAVLPYVAETRRTTMTTTKMIQTFVDSCLKLKRILGVWLELLQYFFF